jgi:response regulator RpfG family c-di-GMP phosphodiesterase
MGLPEPRVELLARAAALHEVGRLAGRTDRENRGREHPAAPLAWTPDVVMASERVLAPIASLRAARDIILRSADPVDAAALPLGAERPGIRVESRILALCEEFVRLTTGGGHDPESLGKALEAIRKRPGREHDREIVEALGRILATGRLGGGGQP